MRIAILTILTWLRRVYLMVTAPAMSIGMPVLALGFFQLAVQGDTGWWFFCFMGFDCLACLIFYWHYSIKWWKPVRSLSF
ncbi:hypothetical protein KKF61_05890 [Patescibacteria group bacterium]|nr:hypothetical protein [Patescibacteria group bacterium]